MLAWLQNKKTKKTRKKQQKTKTKCQKQIYTQSHEKHTGLHLAVEHGHIDVLKLLLKQPNIDATLKNNVIYLNLFVFGFKKKMSFTAKKSILSNNFFFLRFYPLQRTKIGTFFKNFEKKNK